MNQKLENLLNLALETPEEERELTDLLNVGFNEQNRTWELIVKYHGSLDILENLGIVIEYLIAGYAILTVPQQLVDQVAQLEEIEYVEKPKRYYYSQVRPTDTSCIAQVTSREPFLLGQGVLIAILDSGIDYKRMEFRTPQGDTRIRYLWDQTLTAREGQHVPEGFRIGVEFSKGQINEALNAQSSQEQFTLLPSIDVNGHGTAVAGIAAARAAMSGGFLGVAPESDLLIVKLGVPETDGFPRTTEIMRGVTYALRKALELQMPLVINLSFGNNYGAHDGSSLLERFLDNASEIGRTVICVGSGNEGNSAGHFGGNVEINRQVELAVAEYEQSLSVQIWKNFADIYQIVLRSPSGVQGMLSTTIEEGKYTLNLEQTQILVYMGKPSPYSTSQEIFMDFIPQGRPYINSGIWTIIIEPITVVTGQYYLYLSGSAVRSSQTGFYLSTPQVTLTIPSTAAKVITVGAYNSQFDTYADFSGRGYADRERTVGVVTAGLSKPDLVAPGVELLAPDLYGGYTLVTGTSFATPIVTGSAALLMEWGIVRGNDPFLYGEKVKAYLRRGARPIRGESVYPNERVGAYGIIVSS